MATMPTPRPSLGTTERAYVTMLAEASRRGITMTRTKIAKLLYLADLELTRQRGHQATEATWRWLNHGPFDRDLVVIEGRLAESKVVEVTKTHNYFLSPEYRIEAGRAAEDVELLDGSARRVVANMVEAFGKLTPSALAKLTYSTEPMLKARELGEREVELDMDVVLPPPSEEAKSALERLRKAASELTMEEASPEAMDALEEEIDAFGELRRRANRELLG